MSGSISSSTQLLNIADSAPKNTLNTDYTFAISSSIVTGSLLYGFDTIDLVSMGLQDAGQSSENNNKIIIDPPQTLVGNLNPYKPSTIQLNDKGRGRAKRTNSIKLERSLVSIVAEP